MPGATAAGTTPGDISRRIVNSSSVFSTAGKYGYDKQVQIEA
jgi:hypothetical protein